MGFIERNKYVIIIGIVLTLLSMDQSGSLSGARPIGGEIMILPMLIGAAELTRDLREYFAWLFSSEETDE